MVVLKLRLDILELMMKSKKKRILGFLINLVRGGHSVFKFFKGSVLVKTLENPGLDFS